MIRPTSNPSTALGRIGINVQQVRFLKRKLAYPQAYKPQVPPLTHRKKDHTSYFQRHLKGWLGPVNARGEYYRNKYYYPPQDHKPRYVVPDGNTIVDPSKPQVSDDRRYNDTKRNPSLQPFPFNPHCRTASVIPNDLKAKIYEEVTQNGMHSQEVAHKYGIKITRVEAIVKLQQIEQQWKEEVCITNFRRKNVITMMKQFKIRLVLKTSTWLKQHSIPDKNYIYSPYTLLLLYNRNTNPI